MLTHLEQFTKSIHRSIWRVDISGLSPLHRVWIRALRIGYTLLSELADGQLNLRAMSLVYTSLLAMVPLLAVSFSVLKAFGVHNELESMLGNVLVPLGDKGPEISARILSFVDNVKVGVLGSVGVALLLYTVISMVQKVERAFNYTWRVEQPRSVVERFSDYLSVLIIGPVLVFTALGLTATITATSFFQQLASIEPFGMLIRLATQMVPYALVIAAFMFVYMFIPNCKVQPRAALVGGIVAGALWESTGWAFASFVMTTTKYTAIYSSFAILVFFMLWLYVSWLVLLVGASVAFYHQHPEYLGVRGRELHLSNRLKEQVILHCLYLIARHYHDGRPAWTTEDLARRLNVPIEPLRSIFRILRDAGIVVAARTEPASYLLARDYANIGVKEVLDLVRADGDESGFYGRRFESEPVVDRIMQHLDDAVEMTLGNCTLKDMLSNEAVPVVSMGEVLRSAGTQGATRAQRRELGGAG